MTIRMPHGTSYKCLRAVRIIREITAVSGLPGIVAMSTIRVTTDIQAAEAAGEEEP